MRPFTCTGSPLDCELFIVGLNSATVLRRPFWDYWDDASGFDREAFEADYVSLRQKRGVRPNIEQFVLGARPVRCLETNIYAVPTKKARNLRPQDRDPRIFWYLLTTIRPKGIFVHSNEPIDFFKAEVGRHDFIGPAPQPVEVRGTPTLLWGLEGPFYTKSREAAAGLGRQLARRIRSAQ
jgi:hypothetical protein